ncbi:hypothetical protein ACMA5I_12850 [Paracoccaceae bacterium GXU_MW_L88]
MKPLILAFSAVVLVASCTAKPGSFVSPDAAASARAPATPTAAGITGNAVFSQSEMMTIAKRVAAFDRATRQRDVDGIMSVTPPAITEVIAERSGVDAEDLHQALRAQLSAMLSQIELESYSMDMPDATAHRTADGTPYLLIPTHTIINIPGTGRVESHSQTLAMEDAGVWYLVRISEAKQVALLREAYPSFAKEQFPEGTQILLDDDTVARR